MAWMPGIAIALCFCGLISHAAGAKEIPTRIRTFDASSYAEQKFESRARRFEVIGLFTLCLAAVAGVAAVALLFA
jgi:hypothetical protein